MSKFYSKLAYGFVASTAFLCSSGAFAQVCNATTVGGYTEVVDGDGNSWYTLDIDDGFGNVTQGIDTNGGFGYIDAVTGAQVPNRFTELGTHSVGQTLRVNGFTGNFNSTDPFDPALELDKRDLDYMHIKLTTAGYLTIDLSMNDKMATRFCQQIQHILPFNFTVGLIQLEILMVIRLATIQPATISSMANMDTSVHNW